MVVTKNSDDGTFIVGDHLIFYSNGDIGCIEAQGFIIAEEVKKATKGMEYEIDTDWIHKEEKALLKKLNGLKK